MKKPGLFRAFLHLRVAVCVASPASGGFAVKLGQAYACAGVDVGQGVMLVAAHGAVDQPVVVLHVERQPVDNGFHVIQRIDQVVAVLGGACSMVRSSMDIQGLPRRAKPLWPRR
jgi:hypothetical protein